MEYPTTIQIETINFCNAKCDFCVVPFSKRKKEIMDDELFKKIIKDCKNFPLKKICPFLSGEPFLDNKFIDRLEYINKELPDVHFDIFSNMELVTKNKIDRLSTVKNIDSFIMSISGYDKDSLSKHQQTDYNKVYNNIQELVKINTKKRFIYSLQLVSMNYGIKENKKIEEVWKHFKGLDNFFFTVKQNWLGNIQSEKVLELDRICGRAFHFVICSNGEVALCCFDGLCEYSMGDVNKNSILEIYNSDKYSKYRKNIKRNLYPCNRCSV